MFVIRSLPLGERDPTLQLQRVAQRCKQSVPPLPDAEVLAAIAAKHGTRIVGPPLGTEG